MSKNHTISSNFLSIDEAIHLITNHTPLNIAEEAKTKIIKCRAYLEKRLKDPKATFYGINTGFGALYKVKIPNDQIEQLQTNLVLSHAVGLGNEIPNPIVQLMLLLKAKNMAYGHSGVRLKMVQRLIDMFNENVLPVIYKYGSLGASGDLAPLAHLALPLIGEGWVHYQNKKQKSADVLQQLNWQPLQLVSKEGIALLNGTQFMSAYGVWMVHQAHQLSRLANLIAAISIDAYGASVKPFNPSIHKARNQFGQQVAAKYIAGILKDSALAAMEKPQVQDPYSFRCIPQVHGASFDVIVQVQEIVENEINAVTDNPLIFPEEDLIVSGGNFHGQPLALHLDFLKIALAELGNISERRSYKLLNGHNGLPEFLIHEPGLHSGLMMPQYTAASLVSANKQLCSPASVDSISSSNGQEDHVSMGANAATQCYDIVENVKNILAIEFLIAAQALHFRENVLTNKKSSPIIVKIINDYRKIVSFNTQDRLLQDDIAKTTQFISNLHINHNYL